MGSENDEELNCKKYGVPLYGAAWVPSAAFTANELETPAKRLVVLAGGGGEGHSGIPNALLLSAFDSESCSLSDQPVAKLGTGSDLPYRIGVHPGGEGIMCSFPQNCRWFEWDSATSTDDQTLSLKSSEKVLKPLEDVGQQLALTFNTEGNLLAVGGEDGKLRVFKWPAMESILSEANAHSSVKDLDFSPDGKFLVSVGSGPGRIWDVSSSSSSVASLPKENDEIFGFCRFSRSTGTDQVLYITTMRDKGGSIVKWNPTSWRRISSTFVSRDPISAFNVSPDGKLLAIGTIQGDILIISSANMRTRTVIKKAHLGLVTALAFSQDSRAVVSVSLDSSSRATLIKDEKKGINLWIILFFILLAVALYYAKDSGYLPLEL
ncbi:SEC12-like protein 2 isoform X2 [Salvia miltiorrhiza]|uniref:SEC12-like protein 2 isoform X2 n=1 Tax=Salvia miltiorrhiza TaxID=226208 RepID=UPI0025AB9132|nr:SEC12-like protein 2 isoform X2 [Salvia miltiorrhiza]